jgi:glycosyltransferase involved in cell wall biosynthesis
VSYVPRVESVPIEPNYLEYRCGHPLFTLAKAPDLFDQPHVFVGEALRRVAPRTLETLLDWSDIVVVEGPWHVGAITDLADETPVVYSSHNVEMERFRRPDATLVDEWFRSRLRGIERKAVQLSSGVVCTSTRDEAKLRALYNFDTPTAVVPNGTAEENVRDSSAPSAARDRFRRKHDIPEETQVGLFVGTQYPPNVDAVDQIFRVADRAANEGFDVHFLVVGTVSDSFDRTPDNVTTTGYVEHIEPCFDAADFGFTPIRAGSGTNIKLLDCLARQLPTVTTEFGARGFDVTDGTEVLIAEPGEFLDAIRRLCANDDVRRRLASNGRRLVETRYTWERLSSEFREYLRPLAGDSAEVTIS